ncbi:MAG: bifunctional glutamate N-acetyltransferase/amino-acid acetyltransferase ArgJ [Chloroflexota bacterium]|nr:bifunctional glutamate N-acetyltransferase/amino-acid acetyltransferase ArgJ [Chloroflexota bacterium]MDE3101953.1 bifunctional glutamate N-acetyltransferase/amino-acid acetyltransferase ArgJ [Chloroflexota bacterium]
MSAGRGVTFARGFTAGATAAGVKHGDAGRLDVALLVAERPCVAAAAFTRNQVIAAPCVVTRRHVARGPLRAVVVNSGNANACTGEQGEHDALAMAAAAAQAVGARTEEVAVASTGVIGIPLPLDRIVRSLPRIRPTVEGWDPFSRAIMTTDTRPKVAEREVWLRGAPVRIGGIAKGAGMIHPDMATLLAFVTTDARLDTAGAQRALRSAVDASFNAISVDGDTSTNDTALLLASGASGIAVDGDAWEPFVDALTDVCGELARAIVADGEGATKVFEVRVQGAATAADALAAARTITTSNLVKTAIHGADPNWGRILAAAGRSGARLDQRRASVRIGGVDVFSRGSPSTWDANEVRAVFERATIEIDVDLGVGDATAKAWGCDLSAEYVHINADYTT